MKVRVLVQRASSRARLKILFFACLAFDATLTNIDHHGIVRITAMECAAVAA